MKKFFLLFAIVSFTFLSACTAKIGKNEYVVLVNSALKEQPEWMNVANQLKANHQAELVFFNEHPKNALPELQQIKPRYVAIVDIPDHIGRDYIIGVNQMSREVDNDIYADFLWGIITGYTPDAAMRMVQDATTPFVLKSCVSTLNEVAEGKWFDQMAYLEDHNPMTGVYGEKKLGDTAVLQEVVDTANYVELTRRSGNDVVTMKCPDFLKLFVDLYNSYNPDLLLSASHATENNLEMPGSFGNLKCEDGKIYADFPEGKQFLGNRTSRMVYLPIGNCLIGNINNTPNSMAVAFMNSEKASTFVGYIVPTWYGRNGWGGLKYFLTTPGRYSVAEAFYLNQQDMMYQINEWDPNYTKKSFDFNKPLYMTFQEGLMTKDGERLTNDQLGFFHDRDVLAYYGDPKWNVRLQDIPAESDYTVTSEIKDKECTITITTGPEFNLNAMVGNQFKQEHVLDLPFSYFFPERLNNPKVKEDLGKKIAVDENFILVYNPDFEPNQTYQFVLTVE